MLLSLYVDIQFSVFLRSAKYAFTSFDEFNSLLSHINSGCNSLTSVQWTDWIPIQFERLPLSTMSVSSIQTDDKDSICELSTIANSAESPGKFQSWQASMSESMHDLESGKRLALCFSFAKL